MSKQSRQAKAVAAQYGIDTRLTWEKVKKNLYQYRGIYLMLIPVLAFYITFNYAPLQGLQIAFRNYRPGRGIWEAPGWDWQTSSSFSPAPISGVCCGIPCSSAFTPLPSASRLPSCLP